MLEIDTDPRLARAGKHPGYEMPWILSKGGESVFLTIVVCLYFALNACLGFYFHLSVRHEIYLKSKLAELSMPLT
jgi:hypothetical protein